MKNVVVVLDLGTTNVKATVIDIDGIQISNDSRPTPVSYGTNCMEINPEHLWQTVLSCCGSALSLAGDTVHVAAIVISSMAASFIPLDHAGNAMLPAIGWGDQRGTPYMLRYLDQFNKGNQIKECGQYPLEMYGGFKLQWLREAQPEIYDKIHKWVNVSEYIYHRMLADQSFVTDYTIASRSMFFDIDRKTWNHNCLSYFDITPEWLPTPYPSGTLVGTASKETWGYMLSPDTKIILGGHDHMCAIAGAGITEVGHILNSTGTSETLECLLPDAKNPEETAARWVSMESSVLPGRTVAVVYVGGTGRVYQSACDTMKDYITPSEYPMPAAEPIFVPPMRAQMASIRGSMHYINSVFDDKMFTRAIRDGMFYECRRGIQRLTGSNDNKDVLLRLAGGHTKNIFEMQLKCDALGCPIELIRSKDIATTGAFILGGVGCGWFDSVEETSKVFYEKIDKEYLIPDPERSKRYEEIYYEKYLPLFKNGESSL